MASSISAQSTTTSVTFSFTLSSAFTVSNYIEVGVSDRAFINGSYSLSANSVTRYVRTSPSIELETNRVGFTITSWGAASSAITAGSSYTFYGYAKAANGKYYQVPEGGGALTVTTQNYASSAVPPYDLICTRRRESGGSLYLDFSVTVPYDAERLIVEASESSTVDAQGSFTAPSFTKNDALSGFTHVSGNIYAFSVAASELTTYYIHAAIAHRVGEVLEVSDWCGIEAASTPLLNSRISNSKFGMSISGGNYFTCYLERNEWNSGNNANRFSYMTFEMLFNGQPVEITHKRLGSDITELEAHTYIASFTAVETDNLPNRRNGFAVELPNVNTAITARIRIYSYINGVYLQPVDEYGNDYAAELIYTYTVTPAIDKFYWNQSNGSASAQATQAAYGAAYNNGAVSQFSYLVWNDIVDKVKEVLDESGFYWDTAYATYENTKMSAQDKTLTAARFNSARYNVGIHHATGIAEKYGGDTVYGSYILTLVSKLNEWIDTL